MALNLPPPPLREREKTTVNTVAFEGGLPARCMCPAFKHYAGLCKHALAVLIRAPIMQAVAAVTVK